MSAAVNARRKACYNPWWATEGGFEVSKEVRTVIEFATDFLGNSTHDVVAACDNF